MGPEVVDEQVGRLSHTSDIAAAIKELLAGEPHGTCNVTGGGEPKS